MAAPAAPRRVVVGISGASGAALGVQLLRTLQGMSHVETHLVVSNAASLTLQHEVGLGTQDIATLAHHFYDNADVGAAIASGSFQTCGMVIAPCSMRTLAAVAHGMADCLLTRAADVVLKERRRLVLLTREAPLNLAHLRNMQAVTEMGGIVFPPVPAFYHKPQTVQEATQHIVQRVIGLMGLHDEAASHIQQWQGFH